MEELYQVHTAIEQSLIKATMALETSKPAFWLLSLLIMSHMVAKGSAGWGFGGNDPGKVKLRDVQVLTLKDGKMTTGRRSSPVPQLNCVGGSAKGKFRPQVVQCINRGWDGQDVQVSIN